MATPEAILRRYWNYPNFRPGQREVIEAILAGKDVLAIFPTGYGKSLCYQIPGLLQPGIVLVISPLIALMDDQVRRLTTKQIPAVAIHQGVPRRRQHLLWQEILQGKYRFVFLSPERLLLPRTQTLLQQLKPSFLVIDEAHCIVEWGESFRPSYRAIGALRTNWFWRNIPFLALTATATREVERHIIENLHFRPGYQVIRLPVRRNNLILDVQIHARWRERVLSVLDWSQARGVAIVYVRRRRHAETFARWLSRMKLPALAYHAGLPVAVRREREQRWFQEDVRILVATTAFGMGIDKPNVRAVVHIDLPESLDEYVQEVGRAGRDGQLSWGVLALAPDEFKAQVQQWQASFPDTVQLQEVLKHLYMQAGIPYGSGAGRTLILAPEQLERLPLQGVRLLRALNILQSLGWLTCDWDVHQPGELAVNTSPQALYRFRVEHPEWDRFLHQLLRVVPEILEGPQPIREASLSTLLGTNTEDLSRRLQALARLGILQYRKSQSGVLIQFLRDRPDQDRYLLPIHEIQQRYAFLHRRFQGVLRYLASGRVSPACRIQRIEEYFGEQSKPCGQCDLCRQRKHLAQSALRLKPRIQALLQQRPQTAVELASQLRIANLSYLIGILRYLASKGYLQQKEEQWHWVHTTT